MTLILAGLVIGLFFAGTVGFSDLAFMILGGQDDDH